MIAGECNAALRIHGGEPPDVLIVLDRIVMPSGGRRAAEQRETDEATDQAAAPS